MYIYSTLNRFFNLSPLKSHHISMPLKRRLILLTSGSSDTYKSQEEDIIFSVIVFDLGKRIYSLHDLLAGSRKESYVL